MPEIDYYLTPLSPWVYLAGRRPQEIAARHGLTLVYRPLDPRGLFARTGGKVLAERHESRRAYRLQELRRWSARLGVALNPQPMWRDVNPAPAAYAMIAAQRSGGGDMAGLVLSIGRALWEEERDISDDSVIRECLEGAGFDPDLGFKGLLSGAETYAENLERAVEAGVFGFPFWIAPGDERFWGQDRLADLDAYLGARA